MSTALALDSAVPPDAKRSEVAAFLSAFFAELKLTCDFEFVDLSDGNLGVNVKTDATMLRAPNGQRNHVLESLQFLVNKAVNKVGARRWVTLAVNALPEARAPKVAAVAKALLEKPAAKTEASHTSAKKARESHSRGDPAENTLAVEPDNVMSPLGFSLAQKSAKFGRVYAVLNLTPEERARMLQSSQTVSGQRARVEGDGHFRRVVFQPATLAPLPKRIPMPDYDEEE
jgi:hypothetical protein